MKSGTDRQIEAYQTPRPLKQHEERQMEIIKQELKSTPKNCLDVGCADGNFLCALGKEFPEMKLTGIDISDDLLQRGKLNAETKNVDIEFTLTDMLEYSPDQKFDMIVAAGVLGTVDYFEEPLAKWLEWLDKDGRLFIFGRFNTEDADVIIKCRNNYNSTEWEYGMNSYSKETIRKFLKSKGYDCTFEKFNSKGN